MRTSLCTNKNIEEASSLKQKMQWKLLWLFTIPLGFSTTNLVAADEITIMAEQAALVKEKSQSNAQQIEISTGNTPPSKEKTEDVTLNFIEQIGETAREIGQKEDLYASVMIAQATLESGSGQSQLSQVPYFNIFGIKGQYEGHGVSLPTQESDEKGQMYTTHATFCQYENYEASLKDYAKLMKNGLSYDPVFYQGTWKTETRDYTEATQFLTGRYATDPHYQEKLDNLIETYHLTKYDEAKNIGNEESDYILPTDDAIITSTYGKREQGFHRGIDLAVKQGTDIIAAKEGQVTRSEYHPSWGNYVTILHSDGLTTLYAHCKQNLVQPGQIVNQGETIALAGSTGHSTGPHVHFEINRSQNLEQNQLLDPLQVLK